MMTEEPPLTCPQYVRRCRDNPCCRKAGNDARYYCTEIIYSNWRKGSLTPPPVCSDACINAIDVLFNDPLGKNLRCCDCGKFSDIDHNDFAALRGLMDCRIHRGNMNTFCNMSQRYCSRPMQGGGRPTQEDRLEGNRNIIGLLYYVISYR